MIYIALLLLSPFCFADHHDFATKHIKLGKVDNLTISGAYYVTIEQGKPNIAITGEEDTIQSVNVHMSSQDVMISPIVKKKRGWLSRLFGGKYYHSNQYTIGIHITVPDLDSLHLHGASSATVKSDINLEKIEITGASSLDIRAPISSRELDIELRGSSLLSAKSVKTNVLHIVQSGSTRTVFTDLSIRQYAMADISGAAAFESMSINSNQIKLEASGNSTYAVNTLKAKELTVELYGVSSASVESIDANTVHSFLHGSSRFKAKSGEIGRLNKHHTGVSKAKLNNVVINDTR